MKRQTGDLKPHFEPDSPLCGASPPLGGQGTPPDETGQPDYIYDQRNTRHIRFGRCRSDYDGCGWIAVYNALLALGEQADPAEILSALERGGLFLWGYLGTNPFSVRRYFKKRGFLCSFSLFSGRFFERLMRPGAVGIALYFHRRGGHFIALRPLPNDRVQVYNDQYANRRDVRSHKALLSSLGRFRLFLRISRPD